jgi:hypothetical protein
MAKKAPGKRATVIARAVHMLQSEGTLRDNRTMALNIDSIDDLSGLSVTEAEVNEILGIAPASAAQNASNIKPQDKVDLSPVSPAAPNASGRKVQTPAAPVPGDDLVAHRPSYDPNAPLSPAQAHANLVAAERDLHDKQSRVEILSRELRARRAAAAQAIGAWQQSAGRPMTQEQLQRDFLASEAANRRAGVRYGARNVVPANACAIDAYAMASAGSRTSRIGGGEAFRRGATTQRGMKSR